VYPEWASYRAALPHPGKKLQPELFQPRHDDHAPCRSAGERLARNAACLVRPDAPVAFATPAPRADVWTLRARQSSMRGALPPGAQLPAAPDPQETSRRTVCIPFRTTGATGCESYGM